MLRRLSAHRFRNLSHLDWEVPAGRCLLLMLQLNAGQSADPIPLPTAELIDHDGQPFDLAAEARDRLTLVFFGYTYCPDICPMHMTAIAGGLAQLTPERREKVRVVFVTADPDRDTPERLSTWLGSFDESFVGVTGSLDEINGMLAQVGFQPVAFERTDHPDVYYVFHPAVVLGYTPDGVGRLVYFSSTTADTWAHDLDLLTGFDW